MTHALFVTALTIISSKLKVASFLLCLVSHESSLTASNWSRGLFDMIGKVLCLQPSVNTNGRFVWISLIIPFSSSCAITSFALTQRFLSSRMRLRLLSVPCACLSIAVGFILNLRVNAVVHLLLAWWQRLTHASNSLKQLWTPDPATSTPKQGNSNFS